MVAGACGGDGGEEAPDSVGLDADALPDGDDGADADVGDGLDADDADASDVRDAADADDTRDAVDTRDAADTRDTSPPDRGYPGAGLVLRIVEPRGGAGASTTGSVTRVAGVLFGEADAIVWQRGAESGSITPGTFWDSGPIPLVPGDNRVTVTASKGAVATSDSVTITFNPAFEFDDTMTARPSFLWSGAPTEVVFTIPAAVYRNADHDTLKLLRVDASGNVLEAMGGMRDDGALDGSGDEIEGDGVFTVRRALTCGSAGAVWFRASVEVTGEPSYTAVSPIVRIDCLERVPQGACVAHQAIITSAAGDLYDGDAVEDVVARVRAEAGVKAAGPAEDGGGSVWVQFDDGILGVASGPSDGTRAGGEGGGGRPEGAVPVPKAASTRIVDVGSKRAMVLSPFSAELGATDESLAVAEAIGASVCPSYDVTAARALTGADASLARFRTMSSYGVVSIVTHGEALFGGVSEADARDLYRWRHAGPQEVLWTGSPVACAQLQETTQTCTVTASSPLGGCSAGTRCLVTQGTASTTTASGTGVCVDETQVDLRLGRVALSDRGYVALPSFFGAYRGRGFPSSLVHLGACRSMYNGTLASELYAAGARAITGFSGVVGSAWAKARGLELFEDFGAAGATIGDRFVAAEDPGHAGTWWRFFGATNLNLSNAELINGNFETGDAVGWTASGDGRVVSQLGASATVDGKFMGLVSTGLGYTFETGALEQTFCIPEDKQVVDLYWRFMSEEFKEFCGSQYQDTFQVVLAGAAGQVKILDVTVDDLCGYGDGVCADCPSPTPCDPGCIGQDGCHVDDEGVLGSSCSGDYGCACGKDFVGLTPSDVKFDQGGVFTVGWQHTVRDVRALAGTGPVTLRLYATDKGDSVFDTAILIDNIRFR
ncbi:MAG: hypothetical protein KC635_27665 [Myxococcales bacterium]|nr:hypothetical protein [Myxococcales bacterium]MCB9733993.1 hypothetical protein [Deltaproteobacteria bacterium]